MKSWFGQRKIALIDWQSQSTSLNLNEHIGEGLASVFQNKTAQGFHENVEQLKQV